MPSNWSFDQFTEYTAGSTGIDIDQAAASGKDQGVSKTTDTMTNKNSAFFEQLQKVEEQAKKYVSDSTSIAERIAQFYRQFDYSSAEWIPIAGVLE